MHSLSRVALEHALIIIIVLIVRRVIITVQWKWCMHEQAICLVNWLIVLHPCSGIPYTIAVDPDVEKIMLAKKTYGEVAFIQGSILMISMHA